MIPKATIEEIFQTVQIEEIIGDFLQTKKKGADYWACCPFHDEKTPSFSISPSKGIFKCFGCGEGGSSVDFLMKHEHLSYPEALRYIAAKYSIHIEEEKPDENTQLERSKNESLSVINQFAASYFKEQLQSEEGKSIALSYLRERGITDKAITVFDLGYCPSEGSAFANTAQEAGYQKDFLLELGLIKQGERNVYDTYRGRILFPIHNFSGKIIGFGARTLKTDKKIAKYLNSPETPLYSKSKVLYGLFQARNAIAKSDNCFLVEGYTDVIGLYMSGIENAVASSGTSLTTDQIKLIKRYTKNITLLFDGDSAGLKAAFRGIDLILKQGMNVKLISLPEGEDPDSFSKKNSTESLHAFFDENKKDFIHFKTESLLNESKGDPIEKAKVIHSVVESISHIPDQILRSLYIKDCSAILDMEESTLLSELNKLIKRSFLSTQPEAANILKDNPIEHNTHAEKQKEESDIFAPFEKDLLRLVFQYHDQSIILKSKDENQIETEHSLSLPDFILDEIKKDELDFKGEIPKFILRDLLQKKAHNLPLELTQYINHELGDVRAFIVEILAQPYAISNWDRQNIIVKTENLQLKRACLGALYSYKMAIIKRMIDHENKALQTYEKENNLVESQISLKTIAHLSTLYRKMAEEIDRPI